MDRSGKWEWLAALTGVAFVVLVVVGFAVMGEPPDADESASKIVEHYVDNKDSIEIGAFLGGIAGTLLVFFFAYVAKVMRGDETTRSVFPITTVIGAAIIAVAVAFDSTISFAIAEAAEDIEPESVRTLQALWDNDFIPFVLGSQILWFSLALGILRGAALPKWLGWIALLFAVASLTPAAFFAFLAGGIWILVVSVMLALRARSGPASPAPAA